MFCLQHSGPLLQPCITFLVVSLKSSFLPVSRATSASSTVKAFSFPSTPIHGASGVCADLSGNVCIVFTKCIWNLAKYVASAGETHFHCVLCWLCLCVCSKAGPGGHVHPGAAVVLVYMIFFVAVNLFLRDLHVDVIHPVMGTLPLHTHPFSYPPSHSLFNRSLLACLFYLFVHLFCFVLFVCLCSVTY